ncbi:hypothetical protein QA786_15075, partial [Listeria monocytogenes]|uniref:hypothetical protein n=1 Tax=Listeria monocytogenes TaxID=1639 RepID=UPI0024974C84
APKPQLTFEHTALGSFVAEGDIWTSMIPQIDPPLELTLAGRHSSPHESLTVAASALLARFPEIKEAALDFLMDQEEPPPREDFI